jgi:uncharacterized protein involved in response to NO
MPRFGFFAASLPHKPVPRGIARSGPAVLSYGFRPFFLMAGVFAVLAMVLWIGTLTGYWWVGGSAGAIAWHAHEMLFGYTTAALAGFVLTAVPNWTGRLPVSGRPLLGLVLLWIAGRLAQLVPSVLGETASALVDALFLPTLAFVVAREVIVGRNRQNLMVAVVIGALAVLNAAFHLVGLGGGDTGAVVRLTSALYLLLVSVIGGRIVPSFTRNVLARRGEPVPRPQGLADRVALAATFVAGVSWGALPDTLATAALALLAAAAQAWRLGGWRSLRTFGEPLLWVLHLGYAFVPLSLAGIALAALGIVSAPSALHVLTVGVVGLMTVAVMTRATRGHTGRPLAASVPTTISYLCLAAAALLRPTAELVPDLYHPILTLSGTLWIAAYALFVLEHAPMLLGPRVTR